MGYSIRYKIDLINGSWLNSTSFQVIKVETNRGKGPKDVKTTQVFKGGLLDCEAYTRLVKNGYID